MLTTEQRIRRMGLVCSSDLPAILDLYHPLPDGDRRDLYRDAYDVWMSKQAETPEREASREMTLGNCMEGAILDFVGQWYGLTGERHQMLERGVFGANTDLIDRDRKLVVEVKWVGDPRMAARYGEADRFGRTGKALTRRGGHNTPQSVQAQVLWQLLVAGEDYRLGVVAAGRCDGRGVGLYAIDRDDAVCAALARAATRFYEEHVKTGIAPRKASER